MGGLEPPIQSRKSDTYHLPWMAGSGPAMESLYSGPCLLLKTNARITPSTPVAAQAGSASDE